MDRYKEKIKCEICGYEYVKCNRSHHMKSKRHMEGIKDMKIKELMDDKFIKKENIKEIEEAMIKTIKTMMEKKIEEIEIDNKKK
jgi:hypothetical protein